MVAIVASRFSIGYSSIAAGSWRLSSAVTTLKVSWSSRVAG
jgi:hypothetical protein